MFYIQSRDDDFANEVQVKDSEDKDEDTESPYKRSPVQIELAVSETKPFTRYWVTVNRDCYVSNKTNHKLLYP